MNEFAKKYKAAYDLARKYRDAPRTGWVKPGSRAADNQAITVSRREVETLAENLASAYYSSYARLYEVMALQGYMSQLAEDEPDAVMCDKCHNCFLPGWMGGKCPYCAADAAATEEVNRIMGGSQNEDRAD